MAFDIDVRVHRDRFDFHLVSVVDGEGPLFWPTYAFLSDAERDGPNCLGSYLNHVPSDWAPIDAPYRDDIQRFVDQLKRGDFPGAATTVVDPRFPTPEERLTLVKRACDAG